VAWLPAVVSGSRAVAALTLAASAVRLLTVCGHAVQARCDSAVQALRGSSRSMGVSGSPTAAVVGRFLIRH